MILMGGKDIFMQKKELLDLSRKEKKKKKKEPT